MDGPAGGHVLVVLPTSCQIILIGDIQQQRNTTPGLYINLFFFILLAITSYCSGIISFPSYLLLTLRST